MTQAVAIEINRQNVLPGQHAIVMLTMPKLYDWTPLAMPVHVFHGKKTGPVLTILAAVHGDEVNGIEIARRLIKKSFLKKIVGTLIVIPIVNVYGLLYQDRYLLDRRDLNRSFPGSPKGSLAARLAYLLSTEIISKSTYIIDLHTGSASRFNLPQIRTNVDLPTTNQLAHAFNVPVILHAGVPDGSIRQYANERSIPTLLYEAGESLRFDELSIRTGVSGIINVMSELGMIPPQKKSHRKIIATVARSSYWIRAPHSGLLQPLTALGKKIEENELLAKIGNPTTTEEYVVHSPISGIVIGKSNVPLVHEGAALFHIACFEKPNLVAKEVEYLQESFMDAPELLQR
jgi:uncharacterized protein